MKIVICILITFTMLIVSPSAEEENKLLFMTATEIAKSIREKKITSVEVVTKVNSQIQKHNANYNAIVSLNTNALADAKKADESLAQGRILGQLHGVPIALDSNGLPIGIQVVAKRFQDFKLLEIGKVLNEYADKMSYPLQKK